MANKYRLTKSAEFESLGHFREFIDKTCAARGIDEETTYALKLAVDEACTNVITHGYAGMNPGSIILDLEFEPHQIIVRLTDFGHPFEPYAPAAPDMNAALEDRPTSGFGLLIIYGTMDAIDYTTREEGNTLILTKRLTAVNP